MTIENRTGFNRSVREYTSGYISLQETLTKFGLQYNDVSDYFTGKTNELLSKDKLDSLALSEKNLKEIETEVESLRRVILNVKSTLDRLGIPIDDFSKKVEMYFRNEVLAFPESWVGNNLLEQRFEKLVQVAESNPEWWSKWKENISILGNGIIISGINRVLEISDFHGGSSYNNVDRKEKKLPGLAVLERLYDFITSAGEENKSALMNFLGLENGIYLTSTEGGIVGKAWGGQKNVKVFNFSTGKVEYKPVDQVLNTRLFQG